MIFPINTVTEGNNLPDEINIMIEIPKDSSIKYEIDVKTGAIFVDRILPTAMSYPCNYGFIPKTSEDDGGPVDAFVLMNNPLEIMSVIRCRPVAVLVTEDQDGQDSKIIAVPITKIDSSFSEVTDLDNIPGHIFSRLKHFVEHHKDLEEGKYVKVRGWESKEFSKKIISQAAEKYSNEHR